MFSRQEKGKRAEVLAWQYLRRQGCVLQTKNWFCRYGEIDLIVLHGPVLIFVEVRYRQKNDFGGALASLNAAKMGKLKRSAELYLQQTGWQGACRFDAILMDGDDALSWLQNILE